MQANEIINAFIKIIKEDSYLFTPEAIEDIPELQRQLEELKNESLELVTKIIPEWLMKHRTLRNAVLSVMGESETREFYPDDKKKPEGEDYTIENRFRVLQEELQNLYKINKEGNK